MSRAEQVAAIEVLDAEVIATGGEVVTRADRARAIAELDAAIDATKNTFPRLSKAVAEVQRTRAWEADEEFTTALMLGQVQPGDGEQFAAWAQRRYQWGKAHAYGMARAGRVMGAIEAKCAVVHSPQSERQIRPLSRLLALPDADEVIPQVWEQAVDRASGDLSLTGGYIRRIIDEQQLLGKPSAGEKTADLDRKVRQFRGLFNELHRRMNHVDFDDRVIGWINEQMDLAG